MPDGAVLLADVWHPVGRRRRADDPRTHAVRPVDAGDVGPHADRCWPSAATASCCRRCAAPTAPRASRPSSPSATTAAPPPTGSPRSRGATGASAPTGRATWASRSGRWRRPTPSYLEAMVISLSSTHSSWYLGGALALELMINWDLSALNFLHPERGGFAQDITPEGDRAPAAHAHRRVRPPPGRRRAAARRRREPSAVRAADRAPVGATIRTGRRSGSRPQLDALDGADAAHRQLVRRAAPGRVRRLSSRSALGARPSRCASAAAVISTAAVRVRPMPRSAWFDAYLLGDESVDRRCTGLGARAG